MRGEEWVVGRMPKAIRQIIPIGGTPLAGLPPYDGWMDSVVAGGLAGQAVVGRMPKAIRRIIAIGGTPRWGFRPTMDRA